MVSSYTYKEEQRTVKLLYTCYQCLFLVGLLSYVDFEVKISEKLKSHEPERKYAENICFWLEILLGDLP